MIELFQSWVENRHAYAKEWKKKTGGRILGYYCPQVPEEILYAAHILPVRISAGHEPWNETEPQRIEMCRPLCREFLTRGLEERYDYLDGVMISPSGLLVPPAFSGWQLQIPVPFCCCQPPHQVRGPRTSPGLTAELAEFKKSIEEWTDKKITDADLDRGLELLDESRLLMDRALETRKKDNPPLTGLEALYLGTSSQWIDRREHNRVLKEVLEKELPARNLKGGDRIRLILLGSEGDDAEFVRMVESLEARFVIDDRCLGTRYPRNEVIPGEDRLEAIAARYVERPPCPTHDRLDQILKRAKDWRVQGAIIIRQKFRDPPEPDIPALRRALDDVGVPSLVLEPNLPVPPGQSKIRLEAFLETLRPEDLF